MIGLKDIKGNVIYSSEINEGAKRKFTLMKEDYITLPFSLPEPIEVGLGTYIEINEGLFEVIELQKPTFNNNTGGYDYDLRLDAYYWKWKNKIFKFTPEVGGQEASWSLTASLDVHLGVFLRNLKALGYTYRGIEFEFSIDATVENKALSMTYNNTNMIDALSAMAESWQCEWWVTDNVIHFGRCEYGTAVDFEIGVNVADMTASESQSPFATRLYVFGSTRNLPKNYRPLDESIVVSGVVQKRLMLPIGTPYIDAYEGLTEEEAIEEVVVIEDIYPRTQGEIDSIETYQGSVENEDGTTSTETFYRFKDSSINFSSGYILEGEELRIKFESGSLNGMEFGLMFNPNGEAEKNQDGSWNPKAQLFEVVANEDYGRKLPDTTLRPQTDDKYILLNWDSTKIADLGLVAKAEKELLEEGKKILAKRKIDPSTYSCKMMSDYMYGLNSEGKLDESFSKRFSVGDKVNIINKAYFKEGRESRIIGFEYFLDYPFDNPTYQVGESAPYSRIGALESKVESLQLGGITYTQVGGSGVYVIGTNDTTSPTDRNVYSALRSDKTFLRKDKSDRTPHELGVGELEVGNFVTGGVAAGGSGARIDNEGRAEMHSLTIREFMEVPELRSNRNDVISGILWNSPAFGLIKSVDTSRHVCTLKLEEGELSGLRVMDICMGIFSNFGEGSETEDGVDDNGFPTMVGFSTSYFTPIEIIKSGKGVCQFRYQLQEGTSVHPCQSMKFAVYGNFVDKSRQASAYSTRTYKRYISGVNTWKIDPDKHIYAQFGLLDGLTIGGMEMNGYGSYQHNAYISGALIRFTPQQKEELKGESAYSVVLTDYEGIAVLNEDGTLIGGEAQPMNVVTGNDGDIRNVTTDGKNVITDVYRLKTHVQAMRGTTRLHYAFTTEKDGYTITLNPTGCTASVLNGMVAVTSIEDASNASVEIIVTCEGVASFSQTYTITTVADGESVLALTTSAQAVTKNSHGHYEPSSVIIRSVKGTKERKMYMQMYGKKSDTEYVKLDMSKYTNPDVKWDVNLMALEGADYKSVIFRSYKDTLDGKTYESPFDAEVTVNFVNEGSSGAMARNRGEFKSGTQYAYNDEYRDYVWYNDGTSTEVYLRQGKYETTEGCEEGHIKGIPVTDGAYWVKAERSALTAIDTALIDTANIAGFMFKDGLLVSQEQGTEATKNNPKGANIILNGKDGYFKCINADIDGNINVGSLKYKTITSSGSMEGTAFGLGGNIYTLPILEKGQNMEVKVLYPRVDSRTPSTLFMVQVDYRYMSNGTEEGKASIVVPDEEKVWAKIETSVILKENILYTLFGFCDIQGYTTWYIGASYGSTASLPINVNVDNEVIEGSTNPVSGGAVYDKFNELVKVKKISSVDELTNDPILYII